MKTFKNININEFQKISDYENSIIIDIRDEESYSQSCVLDAKHLSMNNIMTFIEEH